MWLDEIYHSLDPIAISFGPVAIRWYGLAYLAGFVCAGIVMYRTARRWRLDYSLDDVLEVIISLAIGIIIGGRLGYVIFYGAGYYLEHPLSILMLSEGGMSFHGGLVGAAVGAWVGCRTAKLSFATAADLIAIGGPIGLFFGRCANFVNGELWGKPTDLPWGVAFESGGGVFRHPSQLYEAILEGIVIFAVLTVLSRRGRGGGRVADGEEPLPQGSFFGTFLVLYGIFRFLIEFVRVPDAQLGYLFGFITMGQLLSLPLVIVGAFLIVRALRAGSPQRGHIG